MRQILNGVILRRLRTKTSSFRMMCFGILDEFLRMWMPSVRPLSYVGRTASPKRNFVKSAWEVRRLEEMGPEFQIP